MSAHRNRKPAAPQRGIGSPRRLDSVLAGIMDDPKYLEVKKQLGEHLTPREQAILDAQAGGDPGGEQRPGGDP